MTLFGGRPGSHRKRMCELVWAMRTASSSSCSPVDCLSRVARADDGSLSNEPVAASAVTPRLWSAEIVVVSALAALPGDGSR